MGVHHCLDQVPDGTEMNTDACCFDIYKGEGEEGGEGRWEGEREGMREGGEGRGVSSKHTV